MVFQGLRLNFLFHGSTATVGQVLPIDEVSRSHSDTPHSIGIFRTSDRPVAEASTWQHTTLAIDISMPPAVFEPATPASERPHTYTLDREAIGIGLC